MEHYNFDEFKPLFSILLMVILLILCISVVIGLFAAGIASFRERKRLLAARQKTAASYPTDGVILDAQLIQEPPTTIHPLHYKYSIRYTDSMGVQHRAFIGISSNSPLQYAPGDAVRLQLFQQSVIVPDAYAFDPNRGKSGMIDCLISFRKWLDQPIDETGTVMLERHYQEIDAEINQKLVSRQRAGWLWCIAGAIVSVITIGVAFSLYLKF